MTIKPDYQIAEAIQALLPKAPHLSDRELQVLKLISHGYDTDRISKRLRTSIKTSDNQRQTLYRKLKVRNAVQAARIFWAAELRVGHSMLVEAK